MHIAIKTAAGVAAAALMATAAHATTFPALGADSGPGIIIDLTPGGANVTATGQGPYDGIEDTYVGVTNNSGSTVGYLDLVSSLPIFGFDGDGICGYNASLCNSSDPSGYAGTNTFFSNITDYYHGRVNFVGGLADGGSAFFTLEESLDAASFSQPPVIGPGGVPEPATWAMMLLGFFGLGAMARSSRRRTAMATA